MTGSGAVSGRDRTPRVLAVEDEMLAAMLLEDMLEQLGFEVVGPLSRLDRAVDMARRERLDAAVLDINVDGELVYPVAEVLAARGIPVVFATGYGRQGLGTGWGERPTLQKPFLIQDLRDALRSVLDRPAS